MDAGWVGRMGADLKACQCFVRHLARTAHVGVASAGGFEIAQELLELAHVLVGASELSGVGEDLLKVALVTVSAVLITNDMGAGPSDGVDIMAVDASGAGCVRRRRIGRVIPPCEGMKLLSVAGAAEFIDVGGLRATFVRRRSVAWLGSCFCSGGGVAAVTGNTRKARSVVDVASKRGQEVGRLCPVTNNAARGADLGNRGRSGHKKEGCNQTVHRWKAPDIGVQIKLLAF